MRILLAGSAPDRARLRDLLRAAAIEIAGEFTTVAGAEESAIEADAIVLAKPQRRHASDLIEPLTSREIQVLELMAEGLSNKGIAARLDISDQTVKFHVASITGKLGASNRTDAVRRAVRHGLITL
jgi:DNA-binding NarL/FixJ family response regulator